VAEEGRGGNEVVQSVNLAANAAANVAANLQPPPPLTPQATSPTMQLMLLVPHKTLPPMQDKTLELNLHQYKPTTPKADNVDAYETKWK
jgi:hypothetical protein